ncbi:hypothetical protein [Pantoea sp. A4]|uniref:hypothetical protein n=1 Tax=Pantoea sp. A4 TaxID=1225184 RepID=UPI00035F6BF6|nr:hypothetical protein [Pantoea sp. A4]
MNRFLTWLKSWFIHTKEESKEMSEPLNDASTAQPVSVEPVTAEAITPAAEAKEGVKDLKAALAFIETGITHLGEAAKDELVALAQKYL